MIDSFCVSFKELEAAAISKLLKKHPKALPIGIEWKMDKDNKNGSAVIWYTKTEKNK